MSIFRMSLRSSTPDVSTSALYNLGASSTEPFSSTICTEPVGEVLVSILVGKDKVEGFATVALLEAQDRKLPLISLSLTRWGTKPFKDRFAHGNYKEANEVSCASRET